MLAQQNPDIDRLCVIYNSNPVVFLFSFYEKHDSLSGHTIS
jgi:hypothetical protein